MGAPAPRSVSGTASLAVSTEATPPRAPPRPPALAHARRRHEQPPTRPGSTSGALTADHDDIASLDSVVHHRGHRRLLTIERPRRADVLTALVTGELDHAAFRRDVPAQDREAPG